MKIVTHSFGAAPRPAASARPAAPAGAGRFEALLAGDPSRDAANQRALGFGELGVFARPTSAGAEAQPARPDGHEATPQVETAGAAPDVAPPERAGPFSPPRLSPQRPRAGASRADLDQAMSALRDQAAETLTIIASPTAASTPGWTAAGPDEDPIPETVPRAPADRSAPSQVSLVLAADGQSLRILAAGFQISPALSEHLRQRISGLAAEHGLTLSELLMDGQPIDIPSFDFQGAIHGDYTR